MTQSGNKAWYKSKTATTVVDEEAGFRACVYHQTKVVRWKFGEKIILDSGGFRSATTKKRMNEVSDYYGLGFLVYQADRQWHVLLPGGTSTHFKDGMEINLDPSSVRVRYP